MIASSFSHSTLSRFVSTVTDPSIGAKFFKAWASSALTHSDGSGISESFLKIDAADADHWNGFDVLLCALM